MLWNRCSTCIFDGDTYRSKIYFSLSIAVYIVEATKQRNWIGPDTILTGDPPAARDGFGMAIVQNFQIYIFGGIMPGNVIVQDLFRCTHRANSRIARAVDLGQVAAVIVVISIVVAVAARQNVSNDGREVKYG